LINKAEIPIAQPSTSKQTRTLYLSQPRDNSRKMEFPNSSVWWV